MQVTRRLALLWFKTWSLSPGKLAELQRSLGEYCSQVPPRSNFYPTIGDICCAQFSGKEEGVVLILLTVRYQQVKDWGQEEKGMTEDEMVGWHHRLDEFEQAPQSW